MRVNNLIIRRVTAKGIEPYLNKIGELRIQVFREFPYLYDGDVEYEKEYLQKYLDSDESIAVLVFDKDNMVGCSTALPLEDESEAFQTPFLTAGIDPKTVF